tara:strand:+ start:173 stop:946 length:774 start_codon:yes stop_codon:yes gene_type:complete
MKKYDLTFGPFQYPDMDKSKKEANFYGRYADYLIKKGFIPSLSDSIGEGRDIVGPEIASTDLKTGHFYINYEEFDGGGGIFSLAYINNIDATDWGIENEDGRRISLQPEGKHRIGIIHLSFPCLRKLSQLLETAQEWSLKDPSLRRDTDFVQQDDWWPLVDYSSMTEEERAKVLTKLLHKIENHNDDPHGCRIGWMPVTGLQYMEEWKDLPQEIVDDLLSTHKDYYGDNGHKFYEINIPPLRRVYGTSDYGLLNWWW